MQYAQNMTCYFLWCKVIQNAVCTYCNTNPRHQVYCTNIPNCWLYLCYVRLYLCCTRTQPKYLMPNLETWRLFNGKLSTVQHTYVCHGNII